MPLKGLTDEQMAAVFFSGNILLTACPGSGKTKTLVSKLAYILSEKNINLGKRKIIAITYTNIAAETILDRLDSYGIDGSSLWIGTIHSFCLEWVIKPYQNLNRRISSGFRVMDEYEQRILVNEIKKEYDIGYFDDFPCALDNQMKIQAPYQSKLYNAIEKYHEYISAHKLIDFDLILSIARDLLLTHPPIHMRLSKLFDSILVDEYQDTNQIQYDIISSIVKNGCTNIMLIGDVDQAIYTNLGAVVKELDELKTEFGIETLQHMTLTGCFRSSQKIIDLYKHFQDFDLNITSLLKAQQEPSNIHFDSEVHKDELCNVVSILLKQYISIGVKPNDIVVVAQSWRDVISLGTKLKQQMPEIKFNSPGISPLPRSLDNFWYYLVRLYFMPTTAENYSKRQRLAKLVLDSVEQIGFHDTSTMINSKKILSIMNSITPPHNERVVHFVERLINEFCSLLGVELTNSKIGKEARNAFLDATENRIADHELLDDASTLFSYFRNGDGVRVTTYHQTKGDEFEVVIATGLVEGKIPHWNDVYHSSKRANYVSRRLLYVICSRAKRYLHLISESGHKTKKGTYLKPTPQLLTVINNRLP